MKRRILRKWLIAVICMALIITAMPVTVLQVFAEGTEVGESEEDMGKNTEDMSGQGEQDNVLANDGATEEESGDNGIDDKPEKDDINEGEESQSGEKDNKEDNLESKSENEEIYMDESIADEFPSTEENEFENSEGIYEEIDKDQNKKVEMLAGSSAEQEMLTIGSVSRGTFGDTNWMISPNGRLTVEGNGEVGNTTAFHDSSYRTLPWYEYREQIISAEIRVTGIKDLSSLFSECSNLTSVDLRHLDSSNVINMNSMFQGCKNLENIEWGDFNTSNVKYMANMFSGCKSLTSLDAVSTFNTSNVTDMQCMFQNCESLTTLDLRNFETSNVTNMRDMFWDCVKLTKLDLSSFTTTNVESMAYMFENCRNLETINLNSFDTSNVRDMTAMFSTCMNLKTLDLSNFDMQNVKNVGSSSFAMLHDCANLDTIYAPINLTQSVELPLVSVAHWYRSDGTEVTELPQGLARSIVLGKNYIPKEKTPDDNPKEDASDDKLKYVRNLTQVSLQNADEESKKSIEDAIYNLLFMAEYRPMQSEIPGDTMDFTGSKEIIATWPIQNKDPIGNTVSDSVLGTITWNYRSAGCMSYACFATAYVYGTNGTQRACANLTANGIKEFIHQYADPGEQLRYNKPHSLVFLGESSDGNGFYCASYEGGVSKRGTFHLLRLMYKSYANFASEIAGSLSVFDTNNGSYYNGRAKSIMDVRSRNGVEKIILRLACPVEATIELNGEILDSRNPSAGSYGMVEHNDDIIFTLNYSSYYNLSIKGTGTGVMTLTLEYYDNTNALIDKRVFVNVPIESSTEIQSSGFDSQSDFVLYVLDGTNEMETWGAGINETIYNSNNIYRSEDDESDNGSEENGDEGDGGNSAGDSSTGDIGNKWQTSDRIDISDGIGAGSVASVEIWKPTTPDEKKRYACMGKEIIQYTLAKDNSYRLIIENAMQGPLCFNSFEAVLGDYMIGRTYNIYPYPTKIYNMSEEVQFTIKIPKAIYSPNRVYRMICVTKGGLPVIYEDLDTNPETITVRTNKFYAYALAYKEIVDTKK